MSSCTTISCDVCDCLYDEAHYDQECPVCKLRTEMEEKIEFLTGQIDSLKDQVDEALCGVQEFRRSRPIE